MQFIASYQNDRNLVAVLDLPSDFHQNDQNIIWFG